MKGIMLIGIVMIVLGIGALAYNGITYTSREKIPDLGPVEATAKTTKTIPISPVISGVSIVGGIVLVVIRRQWILADAVVSGNYKVVQPTKRKGEPEKNYGFDRQVPQVQD